jgi:hypothetical protein
MPSNSCVTSANGSCRVPHVPRVLLPVLFLHATLYVWNLGEFPPSRILIRLHSLQEGAESIGESEDSYLLKALHCQSFVGSLLVVALSTTILFVLYKNNLSLISLTMSRNYRTTVASRERNRVHARKTRMRKKEQMQNLQGQADELKEEQIRLKQIINEKHTANILVGLFSKNSQPKDTEESNDYEDPRIEKLLRRPVEEIPAADKIPELPALILPGQHASTKVNFKATSAVAKKNGHELSYDGIDYDLLGKDRSKCSPEELDQIRRERNRMHAKRTRDRKRLFMDEMAEMCRTLGEENDLLYSHLEIIDPEQSFTLSRPTPWPASPEMVPSEASEDLGDVSSLPGAAPFRPAPLRGFDQVKTLLQAAGSFDIPALSSVSCCGSRSESQDESSCSPVPLSKRPRIGEIPFSITTSTTSGSTTIEC